MLRNRIGELRSEGNIFHTRWRLVIVREQPFFWHPRRRGATRGWWCSSACLFGEFEEPGRGFILRNRTTEVRRECSMSHIIWRHVRVRKQPFFGCRGAARRWWCSRAARIGVVIVGGAARRCGGIRAWSVWPPLPTCVHRLDHPRTPSGFKATLRAQRDGAVSGGHPAGGAAANGAHLSIHAAVYEHVSSLVNLLYRPIRTTSLERRECLVVVGGGAGGLYRLEFVRPTLKHTPPADAHRQSSGSPHGDSTEDCCWA